MFIADWLIPRGYLNLIDRLKYGFTKPDKNIQVELAKNASYKELHHGERCFILGTGPSVVKQDLTLLRKEHCISLNSFYLHKDYSTIRPQYHVVSGLALHRHIPMEIGLKWFKEIENKTDRAELFLNYSDRELIKNKGLFLNKKVLYLLFDNSWDKLDEDGIDATKSLYPSQSVSIMALQIALYMGFSKIILLGMDHDWIFRLATKEYNHFYSPAQSVLEKNGMTDWVKSDWGSELYSQSILLDQYKRINRNIGKRKKQVIYNATVGGLLDVFERVNYQDLIDK